jgi:hypothetical protein
MEFENDSLMADNRRYCAEVTDLAAENSALLAENRELRTEGDTLITEVRSLRQIVAVNRTDLLYLKLKLKGLELRLDEGDDDDAGQRHLQEDIDEWKRNWRRARGQQEMTAIGNETTRSTESGPARLEGGVVGNNDDTRSAISLNDGRQLIITRATGSRAAALRAGRSASSSAGDVASNETADEEEDADEGDWIANDSDGADVETVTQEAVPALEEAVKSPWEKLWDDLAAFAGIQDQGD